MRLLDSLLYENPRLSLNYLTRQTQTRSRPGVSISLAKDPFREGGRKRRRGVIYRPMASSLRGLHIPPFDSIIHQKKRREALTRGEDVSQNERSSTRPHQLQYKAIELTLSFHYQSLSYTFGKLIFSFIVGWRHLLQQREPD